MGRPRRRGERGTGRGQGPRQRGWLEVPVEPQVVVLLDRGSRSAGLELKPTGRRCVCGSWIFMGLGAAVLVGQ